MKSLLKAHPTEEHVCIYEDDHVYAVLWCDGKRSATILEFSSYPPGKGYAKKALARLSKKFSLLGAQDIGLSGDPSYKFWMKMAKDGLVDYLLDDDLKKVYG